MAHQITFTVADEKGDTSTITIPVPDSTALTDLPLMAQALADLLEPMVTGGLVNAFIRIVPTITGWAAAAAADSDVQEKAEFALRTAGGFVKRLNLPTFLESLFNANSKDVNQADADVSAFVTALEDGIDLTGAGGSGIVQPCDLREEDLTSLLYATENWGRRRQ
jgi:hypothetical protein